MKTIIAIMAWSATLLAGNAQQSLEEIVQKRESVLSQLLEIAKNDMKIGRTTQVDVHDASIRLYSFRRDSAKSSGDRIKHQEQIVATEQQLVIDANARVAIGVMGPVDVLRAEERLLAAQQKLAELRLEK